MMQLESLLRKNPGVSDYKINTREKKSYELFFVKGSLETVRSTNTCDTDVTVYVSHGEYLGDANFPVYPSTSEQQLEELIMESVAKAKLIQNEPFTIPDHSEGHYTVKSNLADYRPEDLAAVVSDIVFDANQTENGSINSVEVFVNRYTESVINSRGIRKSQVRYDCIVEAIPTYNGENQSVELYELYNFSELEPDVLRKEISDMMLAVKARYDAEKPTETISCNIILNKLELRDLFREISRKLKYSSVYNHSTVFTKGKPIQKNPVGDRITLTMMGEAKGNILSAKFDNDGLSLGEINVIEDGIAVNYYGSNRYGQYIGESPTGELRCMNVSPGSAGIEEFTGGPHLEIISMSGLQVDFLSDYIGGEVRLAYYHDGQNVTPVTGISISGSVTEALNQIRLSSNIAIQDGYIGPSKAIIPGMHIF